MHFHSRNCIWKCRLWNRGNWSLAQCIKASKWPTSGRYFQFHFIYKYHRFKCDNFSGYAIDNIQNWFTWLLVTDQDMWRHHASKNSKYPPMNITINIISILDQYAKEVTVTVATIGHFYQHGITLIPAWISNHMPSRVWHEITYPFLNFNCCTVEV